jgi:hypothetical protein
MDYHHTYRMTGFQPPGPARTLHREGTSTQFAMGPNPLLSTARIVSSVNITLQATAHINPDSRCIVNFDGSCPSSRVYHQAMVAAKPH